MRPMFRIGIFMGGLIGLLENPDNPIVSAICIVDFILFMKPGEVKE